MGIPRNIKQYLFHNNIGYAHKTHSVAFTAQEIAQAEHVPGKEFAKTVVLRVDGRMILAALPGDHVINLDALKQQIGCGTVSVVSEREFIDQFPECEPGAMPPLGHLYGLPVYCDARLANQAEIEFNAGTHTDAIRMSYANFAKLESPVSCSFSENHPGGALAHVA